MNSDNLSSLNTVTTDLINSQESLTFPKDATTAEPLFFRSYSRKLPNGNRENWYQSTLRVATYLKEVGKLTNEEFELIFSQQLECKSFFSGRLNWVAGTEWLRKPENFYGAFNCNSTNITDIESFGLLMNLAMQGTGTGAVLEPKYIEQLPVVCNRLHIQVVDTIGSVPKKIRIEKTEVYNIADKDIFLYVGDSRQGWVDSYTQLLYLATDPNLDRNLDVKVFVGSVRPKGEDLKGFGGVANPTKLPELYGKVAKVLNKAVGRQLSAVECCLIIDEAAVTVVSGNIRRSAGMKQFNSADTEAMTAKDNLWIQTEDGQWKIDPERDALRMSNHTRVFHTKPTLEEVTASVTKQYYSGEGAIQFAPEAIARANADLLDTDESRKEFIQQYCISEAHGLAYLEAQARYQGHYIDVKEAEHRLSRYGTNPCFSAGTMILTREGHFPIESLVGKVVDVWDGDQWVTIDNFRVTGENQKIYKVTIWDELKQEHLYVFTTLTHTFILSNGEKKELHQLVDGAELLSTETVNDIGHLYFRAYVFDHVADKVYCCTVPTNNRFTLSNGLIVGNCGEINFSNGFCNLGEVHLNRLDPFNLEEIRLAFKAASISVCTLLQQSFVDARYQYSRDLDPIVGVSFTGLFDFFVKAFGVDWLKWWEAGRPDEWKEFNGATWNTAEFFKKEEKRYLQFCQTVVKEEVTAYCVKHGLKVPNRYTTVQPSGSKALLTGASAGWHPPKALVYIRRMTFDRDNPIALACMDYGYNVIPGQSDKDENGNLLTDPHDPRCTEWLVEIPFKCGWADLPGATDVDVSKFSVATQYDFYMQVQRYYTLHNTSATLEMRQHEIPVLSELIHNSIQNDEGYISAALLARFDSLETFPRLPFEPITLETYNKLYQDVLDRRKSDDFISLLAQYDQKAVEAFNQGAAGCDSDKCLMPEVKPLENGKKPYFDYPTSEDVANFLSDSKIIPQESERVEETMSKDQIPVTFKDISVGYVESLNGVEDRIFGTVSISSEAANKLMNEMLSTVDRQVEKNLTFSSQEQLENGTKPYFEVVVDSQTTQKIDQQMVEGLKEGLENSGFIIPEDQEQIE